MGKVNPRALDFHSKMKYLDLLWTSIAQLETRGEVKQFFKDLLSESESIMLSRRIEVAKRLLGGQSYDDISRELKVGKDTIGRVQRWLTSGFGGYEKAINGFKREVDRRFSKAKDFNKKTPYSFDIVSIGLEKNTHYIFYCLIYFPAVKIIKNELVW